MRALFRAADKNVSTKQDTHFINTFSLVIGILVAIAIVIFALARTVASHTQDQAALEEAQHLKASIIASSPSSTRPSPGRTTRALAIKPDTTAAAPAAGSAAIPKSGAEVFQQVCSVCHGAGLAGAPKAGDQGRLGAAHRQGQGDALSARAPGFSGQRGVMPPKGGRVDLPDDLVKAAVDHMVGMAQ